METSDLYKAKDECCGCELCAQTCPKSVICMKSDEQGFFYPVIEDNNHCIDCKKCLKVCPSKTSGRRPNSITQSFSFFLRNEDDLRNSASGGLATAISRKFVMLGGIVYGVTYSDNCLKVKYARAEKIEDLEFFRGSKYSQASKNGLYKEIFSDIKSEKKVLFIGLPCEVSAVYHAIGDKDNLYTISLICHGPTSPKVHSDFCKSLPHSSKSSLVNVSLRYKYRGWKPYYVYAEFQDGTTYLEQFNKTDYNTAFLYLKRPSCRKCKYKADNKLFGLNADLIIGDFHGVEPTSEAYNKWGVSQASILTGKGVELQELIKEDNITYPIPYDVIKKTNRALFIPIPQRGNLHRFVKDYNNHSLHYASNSIFVKWGNFEVETVFFLQRVIRFIRKKLFRK